MDYRCCIGYDVSYKQYRSYWLASMSSHLWKSVGDLSADEKTMALSGVGPHIKKDDTTANYRDLIEITDEVHRTLTSSGEGDNGECLATTPLVSRLHGIGQ
jgi:hypothetical protein